MRIAADGFMDFTDNGKVRLPGAYEERVDALPEKEALSFLLSHSFPGTRTIARPLSEGNRRTLRRALWADSVNQRMDLVDRVWRSITEPAVRNETSESDDPRLLQIVMYGDEWAYPLYQENGTVYVSPRGGVPVGELKRRNGTPRIDVQSG